MSRGAFLKELLYAMAKPVEIARDLRLDLYRGVALWLIFLAHIPGNVVSKFVPFYYGFSDAAEMFVFVSGYANAYVYGRVMQQCGFVTSAAHILNRAFHLYVAQMFLFVVFVGEIALLSHGTDVFADAMNVRIFQEQPDVATGALASHRGGSAERNRFDLNHGARSMAVIHSLT